MAEKKNTPALPQDTNTDWDASIGLIARRLGLCTFAGAAIGILQSKLLRSPAGRWASAAFGAGVGVGSTFEEFYGLSAAMFANPKKSDSPASPDGED